MAVEIEFNNPDIPKGTEVTIDGLGILVNGETRVVSEEEQEQFRTHNSVQHTSYSKKGELVIETEKGPTISQALKKVRGITTKVVNSEPPTPNPEPEPAPTPNGGNK